MVQNMASVGSLEEEALKRKQRLLALRAKKEGKQPDGESTSINAECLPKPVFRSYKPIDDTLKENTLPEPKPAEVKDRVTEQLASAKPQPAVEEVDISLLAPRKPDWDLKRDVAKKLQKLERRTQKAIAELIRERLQSQKENDGESLAYAVGGINQKKKNENE